MKLIIFDIDGTLVDSVKVDDFCFFKSFEDLFDIDLWHADWNNFQHVTDAGLTNEIFQIHFGRLPEQYEVNALKEYFYSMLVNQLDEIEEISGTSKALVELLSHPDFLIAFATGGWKETALLKLSVLNLDTDEVILASSNDQYDRIEITKLAIQKSLIRSNLKEFQSITYVGDGLWDYKTTCELGINFVGIDNHKDEKLAKNGVKLVLNDLDKFVQLQMMNESQIAKQ